MPRKKASKPRENIWTGAPYGQYQGPRGNAKQWRTVFEESCRMSSDEATTIVGDNSPWTILSEMAGMILKIGASLNEIKQAYRRCAQKYHPDKHPDDKKSWATEQFKKAHAAYMTLKGN
jgi:hypothetical protein